MARLRRLIGCGVVVAAGLLATAPTAFGDDAFGGTWTSIDTDGSHQVLDVSSRATTRRPASLVDFGATVCGGSPARLSGSATVDGDALYLTGALTCRPGGNPFPGRLTVIFVYDVNSDTLVDGSGVIWERAS